MEKSLCTAAIRGLLLAFITAGMSLAAEETPKPRSVIFILIDDLRYDGAACLGHPFLQTPNIDRLASSGTVFERAYVTTALCSPSRASILTGQYMHRHRVFDNNNPPPEGTVYFPQHLQKAGYQTAFIGKWHMGGGDAPQPGFDRWVSFKGQGHYMPPGPLWSLNVDGDQKPQKGYITDELTDYAIDWLNQLDPNRPFFLYLSHKAVHAPFDPAPRYRGKYQSQAVNLPRLDPSFDSDPDVPMWVKNQRNSWHGVEFPYHSNLDFEKFYRTYCETLLSVDDSVGRVLAWLEQKGLSRDVAVFFMGDNGFLWGEHGLIDKRCAYEESMRVPLIVSCPAVGSPKRVDELAANVDIAPTVLELAGVSRPEGMDGRSLVPLLSSAEPSKVPWREAILYEYFWEWNFPHTPTMFAIRTPKHKFIEYHGVWDTDELFDVVADPRESRNLIRDPAHRTLATKLRRDLHELMRESGAEQIPIPNKQSGGANKRNAGGSKAAEFPDYLLHQSKD